MQESIIKHVIYEIVKVLIYLRLLKASNKWIRNTIKDTNEETHSLALMKLCFQ